MNVMTLCISCRYSNIGDNGVAHLCNMAKHRDPCSTASSITLCCKVHLSNLLYMDAVEHFDYLLT